MTTAAVLAAAAVAVAVSARGTHGQVVVAPNSVVAIDPGTGRVVGDVPVGNGPTSLAVDAKAVWALNADDHTISKVDPESLVRSATFAIAAEPTDLAVGDGAVWVGTGVPVDSAEFFATLDPVAVTRIDPQSTVVTGKVDLPPSTGGSLVRRWTGQRQIVARHGTTWVVDADGTLWRIGQGAAEEAPLSDGLVARALAVGPSGLWVVGDGAVALVDPATGRVSSRAAIATTTLAAVAAGRNSAWVTDPIAGTLWRVDPGPKPVTRTIPVGAGAWSVAYGAGSVWVANTVDATILRVDPATDTVVDRIPLPATPNEIAFGAGRLWVTVDGASGASTPAGAPAAPITDALPASSCGPVSYGGKGEPDLLIASDLPLQTGQRGITFPMAQAIEFVLARHHFRAGGYTVGYQSCDDATAQAGGWDEAKCVGNAQLYARQRNLVGVVGPYNSACAAMALPVLNTAPGGPVAMVSPATSWPGLTRRLPGGPPDESGALYPTGTRNFARVATTDDYQAAADALLARDLGARRVLVVQEAAEDPWIAMIGDSFRRAAARLGLELAGDAGWDPNDSNHESLTAQVRQAHPDAVFVAGVVFDGGGPVVQAIRAAVGPSTPVIAADAFSVIPYLRETAGAAATGMYVSTLGAPDSALGPAGRRFVRQFAATQPAAVPSFTASYAAQAAELLLAAIARSDGTRASVSRSLFGTEVPDGILGPLRINANGDSSFQAVTILRVTGDGAPSPTQLADHTGAVVDRVLNPARDLVG